MLLFVETRLNWFWLAFRRPCTPPQVFTVILNNYCSAEAAVVGSTADNIVTWCIDEKNDIYIYQQIHSSMSNISHLSLLWTFFSKFWVFSLKNIARILRGKIVLNLFINLFYSDPYPLHFRINFTVLKNRNNKFKIANTHDTTKCWTL